MAGESAQTTLDRQDVTTLRGVGPRLAGRLQRLGIHSVQDLLFHLPAHYEDRTRVAPIGSLLPGMRVLVEGTVDLAEVVQRRRRALLVRLSDGTGAITLRFFHFNAGLRAQLARGARLRCFGEVRNGPGSLEMVHPECRPVDSDGVTGVDASLTPVYPATDGLQQASLRKLTRQALAMMDAASLPDWLPERLIARHGLPALREALRYVHRPPPEASLKQLEAGRHPAQQRLVFEELLAHHLSLKRLRASLRRHAAPPLAAAGGLRRRLLESLPFRLTSAQQRVIGEILADLAHPRPMLRLVQGDVGSGKTVVAACAVLQALEAGCQAAVMAPTELLAEQHRRSFSAWLEPLGVGVGWLSGRSKGRARGATLAGLADGSIRLVVGTHALFQEDVAFAALGLVVIDEQHRFGVHQRLALTEKGHGEGRRPHQLIMTATPIPRTLAMASYADLDLSVIDELPPGRTPVRTVVVPDSRRHEVIERVRQACAGGRQSYWVCTLIEESDALQAQAAEETLAQLREALPGLRVGLVHGRMKAADKDAAMSAFKAGDLDLLVATTVIEVGVDVPNASLMVIENAERLGLAQLHQLRGRVGRGSTESNCVLLYHGPLGKLARARLGVLRDSHDGFEIARRDLELRGPGEVLGTRQTGEMQFHIADLLRDRELLPAVGEVARRLMREAPGAVTPLIRRWLGDGQRYGGV